MRSLREALQQIGVPPGQQPMRALPSGFASAPASLRAAIDAMEDPRPSLWAVQSEHNYGEDWTQNCQGVAHGDGHWYFTSNGSFVSESLGGSPRAIYKIHDGHVVAQLLVPDDQALHLGSAHFHGGVLRAAVEGSPAAPHGSAVLRVDAALMSSQVRPLLGAGGGAPPQGGSMPWCAVNPWNGLLYSSRFDDVHVVHAYTATAGGFRHVPARDIPLPSSPKVDRVQGGCFSPDGQLYLACDVFVRDEHKAIHVFSALNGWYRGAVDVLADQPNQELEGMCFTDAATGTSTQLHVVLLEVHFWEKDDIFLKHYAHPGV